VAILGYVRVSTGSQSLLQPDCRDCADPRRPRGLVNLIDYAGCRGVGDAKLSAT
jgi:hypothetical protein